MLTGGGGGTVLTGGGGGAIAATKAAWSSVTSAAAGGGAWALAPVAPVVAAAVTVAAQKAVEEEIKNDWAEASAEVAALEAAGADTTTLKKLTNANYNVGENGNLKTGALGWFLDLNDTDQTQRVLESMSDVKKRGLIYADLGKYGLEDDNIMGWSPKAMMERWWGTYVDPVTGEHEDMPLTQAEMNALVEYLRQLEIRKLTATGGIDNSTKSYGVRELPSGWEYDKFGIPRRTYETGDATADSFQYNHLSTTEFGMMDDRQYMAWLAQENARYSALHGGESSADSEQTTTITRTMENLPKNLADSLKNVSIVMDKEKVGYIIAGIVSQRIASEVQ